MHGSVKDPAEYGDWALCLALWSRLDEYRYHSTIAAMPGAEAPPWPEFAELLIRSGHAVPAGAPGTAFELRQATKIEWLGQLDTSIGVGTAKRNLLRNWFESQIGRAHV